MGSHGELLVITRGYLMAWMDREALRKDVDPRLEEVNKLVEARVSTRFSTAF